MMFGSSSSSKKAHEKSSPSQPSNKNSLRTVLGPELRVSPKVAKSSPEVPATDHQQNSVKEANSNDEDDERGMDVEI